MSTFIAVAADLLVAVLLAATILTALRLSSRLRGLKADEAAMRGTVAELIAAAASAERAVGGLRATLAETERQLAASLRDARSLADQLDGRIGAGQAVMERVGRIAEMSRQAAIGTPRTERAEALRSTGSTLDGMVARRAGQPQGPGQGPAREVLQELAA